jgi:hypothetical protein
MGLFWFAKGFWFYVASISIQFLRFAPKSLDVLARHLNFGGWSGVQKVIE